MMTDRPANSERPVRLFTIPEVAHQLRLSRVTVYRLISDGALRAVNIGRDGRTRKRVRVDDLQAFIDSLEEVS